jgi:hypothetical protein
MPRINLKRRKLMNRIGKTLLTIGTVAAAALALGIFAPKAAYAKAPVQQPVKQPYTATCSIDGDYPTGTPPLSCTLSPAPPPNVQTVIQSVDISLNVFELSQGPGVPLYGLLTGYSAIGAETYVPFTIAPGPSVIWVAHELTAINVDPNRTVQCNAVELNLHPDAILTCTVSGYFIGQQQ